MKHLGRFGGAIRGFMKQFKWFQVHMWDFQHILFARFVEFFYIYPPKEKSLLHLVTKGPSNGAMKRGPCLNPIASQHNPSAVIETSMHCCLLI